MCNYTLYRGLVIIYKKRFKKMSGVKEKLHGLKLELLNDKGNMMLDGVIVIGIGLIVLVAIFSIAPIIGSSIDESTVIVATSDWNATTNTDLTTGVNLWGQCASLLFLIVMISIIVKIVSIFGKMSDKEGK